MVTIVGGKGGGGRFELHLTHTQQHAHPPAKHIICRSKRWDRAFRDRIAGVRGEELGPLRLLHYISTSAGVRAACVAAMMTSFVGRQEGGFVLPTGSTLARSPSMQVVSFFTPTCAAMVMLVVNSFVGKNSLDAPTALTAL